MDNYFIEMMKTQKIVIIPFGFFSFYQLDKIIYFILVFYFVKRRYHFKQKILKLAFCYEKKRLSFNLFAQFDLIKITVPLN